MTARYSLKIKAGKKVSIGTNPSFSQRAAVQRKDAWDGDLVAMLLT